uniref:Uncharacterized protein n=1 Tax=Anguilla anguilla TaxID=7936 RepID=A0A0E9RNG4_ANGAN
MGMAGHVSDRMCPRSAIAKSKCLNSVKEHKTSLLTCVFSVHHSFCSFTLVH